MMIVLAVLGATVGVVAVAGIIFWRKMAASDARNLARVERHGLKEFNARLLEQITDGKRPMEHLSLTRMMCEILEQVQADAPAGQVAVVAPPDDGYRLACEELVALGKLQPGPDGGYLPK